MKILLVGPNWIGGWTEGVERSLGELKTDSMVFYYDTPSAPTKMLNRIRVIRYLPASLHKYLLPLAERLGNAWESRMNDRLLWTARSFKPDLVLILKGETILAKTLEGIQNLGARLATWWMDDPFAYLKSHSQVSAQFEYADAFFVFDHERMGELKSMGAKGPTYLPCCFDPHVYHVKKSSESDRKRFLCDIGLVASYYPERGELLRVMKGLDVAVWGGGWKNTDEMKAFSKETLRGKRLSGPEIATLYGIARICPNIHHSQTLSGGLNLRAFEIPAAGGFQLVDDVPGLDEHFEVGREIIVYKSPDHFRELADYYLAHPSERTAVVERGQARVMRDHTYLQRMKVLLNIVDERVGL